MKEKGKEKEMEEKAKETEMKEKAKKMEEKAKEMEMKEKAKEMKEKAKEMKEKGKEKEMEEKGQEREMEERVEEMEEKEQETANDYMGDHVDKDKEWGIMSQNKFISTHLPHFSFFVPDGKDPFYPRFIQEVEMGTPEAAEVMNGNRIIIHCHYSFYLLDWPPVLIVHNFFNDAD